MRSLDPLVSFGSCDGLLLDAHRDGDREVFTTRQLFDAVVLEMLYKTGGACSLQACVVILKV